MLQKSSSRQFLPTNLSKYKIYSAITLVSTLLFLGLLYGYRHLKLKKIYIEGNNPEKKLTGLESLNGSSLIFLSDKQILEIIYKNNPSIRIEGIKKEFPDKLFIKIKVLDSIAQLKLNTGYAHLSEGGKIFKKIKGVDSELPVINFYQQFDYYQTNVGQTLDYEELKTALFLLKRCLDLTVQVESIDISGLSMIVFNLKDLSKEKKGRKVLFTAEKQAEEQANELETLLRQFKIKAQDFQTIDLRFDKPIVKF